MPRESIARFKGNGWAWLMVVRVILMCLGLVLYVKEPHQFEVSKDGLLETRYEMRLQWVM